MTRFTDQQLLDLLTDYRRSGEWDRARKELSGSAHAQLLLLLTQVFWELALRIDEAAKCEEEVSPAL
jgi:predicted ATP-dependent Lon-type protease